MNLRYLLNFLFLLALSAGCRGCDDDVKNLRPSLAISPLALDFGGVKVGARGEGGLTLSAQSQASVSIGQIRIDDAEADAAFFEILEAPTSVAPLSEGRVRLGFKPTEYRAYLATVVIESDDPDRPEIRVPVLGEGASPQINVTPSCELARQCVAAVTAEPLAIDFGAEPFVRLLPIEVTALPQVAVVNEGAVELNVTRVGIEGADAAAFTFAGNGAIPSQGLLLGAGEGFNLAIRFVPTSEAQTSYQATVVIESDDLSRPTIQIHLSGTLRANLPPAVCANIIKVIPGDGSAPVNYGSTQEWAALLVPPPGGYDFSQSRDIRPESEVTFSALSDVNSATACTADPEDGRTGLTFEWKVTSAPAEAGVLQLATAHTAQATLRPKAGSGFATGPYTVELTVKDVQGHATVVPLHFVIAIKEDLVVQLSWTGYADVDLDLHLVRPSAVTNPGDPFSGAFSYFNAGVGNKTAGDIHGYAVNVQKSNAGFNFDWGDTGTSDDPRLNLDDTGAGQLIENISLNYPENDPLCATASCTYKVLVHYFRDARPLANPGGCTVDGSGCRDGDRCDCANASHRCVANSAGQNVAATGAGKCFDAPKPVVRVFIRGDPTPAMTIPLETDPQVLPAPCQVFYLADVVWPARSGLDGGPRPTPTVVVRGADPSGQITNPEIARFGYRQANSLQCSPNLAQGLVDWYALEPTL